MGDIVYLRPKLYEAKEFTATTPAGTFVASGTLCGCIDFVVPNIGTYPITPNEALDLAQVLLSSRTDVLENSRPFSDPRLY